MVSGTIPRRLSYSSKGWRADAQRAEGIRCRAPASTPICKLRICRLSSYHDRRNLMLDLGRDVPARNPKVPSTRPPYRGTSPLRKRPTPRAFVAARLRAHHFAFPGVHGQEHALGAPGRGLRTQPSTRTASERRGNNGQGFKDISLKAKAITWP